jgi:hypothetical protein
VLTDNGIQFTNLPKNLPRSVARYGAAGISVKIRRKARSEWLALMPNAHEGYVSWEKAETIRKIVGSNVPHQSPSRCAQARPQRRQRGRPASKASLPSVIGCRLNFWTSVYGRS